MNLCSVVDGLIGLGVLGGAAAVGGVLAAGAVALIGLAVAKKKQWFQLMTNIIVLLYRANT